MKTLLQLIEYGQSYWMDNLSRAIIQSGELEKRVKEQGLRGITSNPTIFNKAISGGSDYHAQIKELVEQGKEIHQIYEELTVKDVQDACDILRPVYEESNSLDGYVSLEVSPYLAHDTEATMDEVRRLFNAVDRPNVFIKIPGTSGGVPAIEQMLYEGMNINITLLFSIASYEAVANAYVRALERRVKENKPVEGVASVASFFLSRIDVLADQLLGHLIKPEVTQGNSPRPEQLLGKVAVASAKLAYQSFKKIFSGNRWQTLVEKGARVQRPLWASTSTKNPLYGDVRYVEPLIGPHTVNTMPESTIEAFADHGVIKENSLEADLDEAQQIFNDLRDVGIDLEKVTWQLVNEGVQKFIDPYDQLMATLAENRDKILEGFGNSPGFMSISSFGNIESKVTSAYKEFDSQQLGRRLYAKDPLLWTSDPDQAKAIRNRLGWLDSIKLFAEKVDEIQDFAREIKSAKYTHVVLLGMGGSSLCAEVARESFGTIEGWPQLLVLDNTDPSAIRALETIIEPTSTLFLVSSKSGTTTETLSFYSYFFDKTKKHIQNKVGQNFVAITDPGTPLVEEARSHKFRRIFENSEDIGGRYSVLSYFGLVPMALMGIDIKQMLENAHRMQISCGPFLPTKSNPGLSLGILLGMSHRYFRDKVTLVLSDSIQAFADWTEQLLAESTGKENKGLVPVAAEPLGPPDVYEDDRIFVYMYTVDEANNEVKEKLEKLEDAGHPVIRIELENKLNLGREFFHWEIATSAAGAVMGINPFDEPNVAESKKNTRELLQEWKEKGSFSEGSPLLSGDGLTVYANESQEWMTQVEKDSLNVFLNSFLKLANSPDYVALLPYFLRTTHRHDLLQTIRNELRDRFKVATTLGYGPRYLHSTGQLHKGGLGTGVFLLFTAESGEDIAIPGKKMDFATLQRAQALGDFRSLNDKKRRVIRIHLGDDIDTGLKNIYQILKTDI